MPPSYAVKDISPQELDLVHPPSQLKGHLYAYASSDGRFCSGLMYPKSEDSPINSPSDLMTPKADRHKKNGLR